MEPLIFTEIERAIKEQSFCRVFSQTGDEFFCFILAFDGAYIKTKTMCGIGNNEDDSDDIFMDRLLAIDLILEFDIDVIHLIPFSRLQAFKYYRELFYKKKKRGRPKKTEQKTI